MAALVEIPADSLLADVDALIGVLDRRVGREQVGDVVPHSLVPVEPIRPLEPLDVIGVADQVGALFQCANLPDASSLPDECGCTRKGAGRRP